VLLRCVSGNEIHISVSNLGLSKSTGLPSIHRQKLALRGGSSTATVAASSPIVLVNDDENSQNSNPLAMTGAHWMTAGDCLHSFQVDKTVGLSQAEGVRRKEQYGLNILQPPPSVPLWRLIAEQFEDRLVQILLAVAVLSSFLAAIEKDVHAFIEPVIIVSILTINAAVGVWQSKSAEDSLEALKKLQPETACVLREGIWQGEFPAASVVPGDIIYLRVGDKVPADARVIGLKTTTFSTDESTLTGESFSVPKSVEPVEATARISGKENIVFSGTMVANGGCYAVVIGTGASTEIGKINAGVIAASVTSVKTPLTQKLDHFSTQLTRIIGVICTIVWVVSIPKFGSPAFGSWMRGETSCDLM
jgi:P-type Ca2+ transporter type 2C